MEPLDEAQWERRRSVCRSALDQIAWLVGRWRGVSESDEGIHVSYVDTHLLFDGTFIESRDRTYSPTGQLEHEDLTVYGATPERGPYELWAQLYMQGGVSTRYTVLVAGETILCEPEGYGARLSAAREGDGYRLKVYFPDENASWVEASSTAYEPIE